MLIYNPLEQFEIFITFLLFTPFFTIIITNFVIFGLIVFITILLLLLNFNINIKIINKRIIPIEFLYFFINNLVKNQIGNTLYLPFIFSLFILIAITNFFGMIPYSFTPTAHFALTLSLSFSIIIGVTILGFYTHGIKFFSIFIPSGTPVGLIPLLVFIETISYIARSISLGARLTINLIGGHMLLKIIGTFTYKILFSKFFYITLFPFIILTLLVGLELGISILQAYIFSILTCIYIKDSIYLH